MKRFLFILLCLASLAGAAEVIPPTPEKYFNDYAGVISPAEADRLNKDLEEFEKTTSTQVLVAIFRKMQSDSSLEDYTVRVAESWKVGQKKQDNGAVLFVFIDDRKIRVEVGYGLEGALPDITAKQIIDNEITPHFKQGDFDAGISAGVAAILQATRGEYEASGNISWPSVSFDTVFLILIGIFLLLDWLIFRFFRRSRRGKTYRGKGRSGGWLDSLSSGGSSGGYSGGGGGFSGGGGSFGGGGASGSW